MPDTATTLIELYNELDKYFESRDQRGSDRYVPFTRRVQSLARSDATVAHYKDELLLMADIRNILVHETYLEGDINPIVLPSDKLIERYRAMYERITRPPLALDEVAVKGEEIFSVSMDDHVLWAMKRMIQRGYSHAPLLEDKRVVGVFSEYSIFAYLAHEGRSLDPDLRIRTLQDGLELSRYKPERYRFTGPEASVYDVESMFSQTLQSGGRLAVVFITADGTKAGRLLGMVTAFNIAGY